MTLCFLFPRFIFPYPSSLSPLDFFKEGVALGSNGRVHYVLELTYLGKLCRIFGSLAWDAICDVG
jgi:hypothetical protein